MSRDRIAKPLTALVVLGLAAGAGLAAPPAYAAPPVRSATATQTAAFQHRLTGALQNMLDAVVGPGRSVVAANVELDFDQVETVSTTYRRDPAAGALSEQISRRSYDGGTGGTRYESTSATRVNALDSLRETRRESPGRIVRLTVAVLVDTTAAENVDLARVRELVGVAAGTDPRRGDAVTVAAMPLHTGPAAAAVPTLPPASTGRPWTVVAAALAVLVLSLLLAGRRRRSRVTRLSAHRDHLEPLRAGLHQQRPPVAAAALPAAPRHDSGGRQREIGRAVDPEQAAAQLRGWLGPGR